MPDRKSEDPTPARGINEAALGRQDREPLGGTGGSAGGGTSAGRGEPSGGQVDRSDAGGPRARAAAGGIADEADEEIAREARALGPADGSLADAAAGGRNDPAVRTGPVGAESIGTGPGRGEAGSGPPQDHGELGGGGPPGQHGGSGPASSDGGD